MKEVINLTSLEQIKAYSDPYRLKIITFLRNNGDAATVKEIADFFGEVPAKVHYHIKKLEKAGILELVRTKEIKGIIAKYYFLTAESFNIEGEQIKTEAKQVYKSQILNIVTDYYDKSKEKIIATISNKANTDNEENSMMLNFRDIYLTEDEFVELNYQIKDLLKKYEKKEEGKIPCHIFSVCLKQENKLEDFKVNKEKESC